MSAFRLGPGGVEIRLGQRWKELDPRFKRTVEIVGWIEDKIQIRTMPNGRLSWANIERFNGKNRGYQLHVLW